METQEFQIRRDEQGRGWVNVNGIDIEITAFHALIQSGEIVL